jgi:uncharacterized protein YegP (UPF0339 family)
MSGIQGVNNSLFRLYEQYVGEADSAKDVYGYWVFIVGYLSGMLGTVIYILGPAQASGQQFLLREISITIAAGGLAVALFGIVLLLPVRQRGIQASVVGLAVALGGVTWFVLAYPQSWAPNQGNPAVMAVYAVGCGGLAGITALVPVLTGERAMLVETEGITEHPDIMLGEAMEDAMFAVHRNDRGDWTWNVVHEEAMAAATGSARTRPDAEEAIAALKEQIGNARLLEITTAAFRLYENAEDGWRWMLMRDDGSVVAESQNEFGARDGAENDVSFLKDRAPSAEVVEIEGAAFSYQQDDDGWHWELLDDERRALASGVAAANSRSSAVDEAERAGDLLEAGRTIVLESFGAELYEVGDGWRWRVIDGEQRELVTSRETHDGRRSAEAAAERVLDDLTDAGTTVAGDPTYEVLADGDAWAWRLVDDGDDVIARHVEPLVDQSSAERDARALQSGAADADVVDVDGAAYETYPEKGSTPEDEEWHWRLITEDRAVVADSTEAHDSDEAARESIERVRSQAAEADLIEFEEAAFQVYEAESGEWRWRLIDEDGAVMADSGAEHESRGEAAEAMMTLKEKAPDADIIEIDTAAFELFRDDDRGGWGWRLIDEAGKLIAEDPHVHGSRSSAREAMDELTSDLHADVRTMDAPAFQSYTDGDDWRWRFVLPENRTVAASAGAHPTRDDLHQSVEELRDDATVASVFTVGDLSVQLTETDEWRFRLLDRDRDVLADGKQSYETEDAVRSVVDDLRSDASDAPVFVSDAAIWVTQSDAGWQWELLSADRESLATGREARRSSSEVVEEVERVQRLAPAAGEVDFGVASFEVYPEEDGEAPSWRWRLLDDGRTVVTEGASSYPSERAAREALDDVRELIGGASILEIDSAAFELHAADDGWRWKLVDDNGDPMATSTQVYGTRVEAREAMNTVKDTAPDGWVNFAERQRV